MAKNIIVTFAGGLGDSSLNAQGAKAGDRVLSVSRIDVPGGAALGNFGEYIPADNRIYQIPSGDLTGQTFVALLERVSES